MDDIENRYLIRNLNSEDRPREKARTLGIRNLSDTELMAIIFSTGLKGKSVIELADDILRDNNRHLSRVAQLTVDDFLTRYKGIGPAKAITLLAALELGRRAARDETLSRVTKITCSQDAYAVMSTHLVGLSHEEFWVMLLSRSGKIITEKLIGKGGVVSTTVDIKIILKEAITNLASSIILFHNHPSGTLSPSIEDDRLTKRIKDAAHMVDINVHDHIILTDNGYYSYADNGRL